MEKTYENLCSVIIDLGIICGTLDSVGKRLEITTPRVSVDDYYKILLASQQIRGIIENLKGVVRETESVTSTT